MPRRTRPVLAVVIAFTAVAGSAALSGAQGAAAGVAHHPGGLTGTPSQQATQALKTLFDSPVVELQVSFAQIHLGSASTAVSKLRVLIEASSGSNADLSAKGVSSKAAVLAELDAGTAMLVQLRDVAGHSYLLLQPGNLGHLGLHLWAAEQAEVSSIGGIIGGRWFALPASTTAPVKAASGSATSSLMSPKFPPGTLVTAHTSSAGTTIEIDGSLGSKYSSILGEIDLLDPSAASNLPGKAALKASRFVATLQAGPSGVLDSMSIQLTAGSSSVVARAEVTHTPFSVSAPSGAVPFPSKALEALVAGALSGSGGSSA